MEILLQIFLEFFLEVGAEFILELGIHILSAAPWARQTVSAVLAGLMYFALGVLVGGISIPFFPHSFVRSSGLHGISLIITPILCGLTMSAIGWLRARQGVSRIRLDSFAYGFIFAFGMALVRLLFTT
jgi:hypothetical protein